MEGTRTPGLLIRSARRAISSIFGSYVLTLFIFDVSQAFTVSLPPLCANVLFLIKETSVFSVCAVPDLMYIAKDLIGLYYKTDETLWMLVISYLIILLPISAGASLLERSLRH